MDPPEIDSVHFRACPLCEATCGLRIEVKDDRVVTIKGDREDPFSRGHVCPKAVALRDIHEDPDRLRQPLRRTTSGWEEVSWQDALDQAAQGIYDVQRRHGVSAFASYLGNPTVHNLGAMLFVPVFLRHLASRSIFSATSVDQLPHMVAAQQVFGHRMLVPIPDVDHTDYLLILGANPIASNGSLMTVPDVRRRFQAIRERGGKIVVIDPRRTETAEIADAHHFIRPGTDALLLLSLLKELLDDGARLRHLHDLCDGLDQLHEVTAGVTPESAAAHTGIDAATIRRLADELRGAPSAACYGRMGTSTQAFGGLCQWLIIAINAVSGNMDRNGGVMFTQPAFDIIHGPRALTAGRGRLGHRTSRVRRLPDFASELPVAALAEEILTAGDGQIRGLLCFAGNPVLSTPNGPQLEGALASLDLMVSIDPYLNETSCHARLILPPTSPLERSHYDITFHALAIRNTARYSPPLFDAPAGTMHDWQILLELQHRLARLRGRHRLKNEALYHALRLLGPEGLLAIGLRFGPHGRRLNPLSSGLTLKSLLRQPHGVDLGPLQPCLRQRLPAAHRRIDLAPQPLLEDVNRLLQTFADERGEPENGRLALIGRRHLRDNNSWMHSFKPLMRGKPRCTLLIHPADARARGLADQNLATVTSRVGSVTVRVTVTEDVMPGVVSLPHGYGHTREGARLSVASAHAGVSINDLTDEQLVDDLTGTAAFSGTPVTVTSNS
jgi:anaerobic selenocysteine-containing dehydrogenase